MIPAQFDYSAPESVADAVGLLQGRPGARVLAGGLDLLTQMKLRHVSPPLLVDLRKIASLRGVQLLDDSLHVGAMTTCAEIVASQAIQDGYQVLAEAADVMGDAQVRNVSTIGGNLAGGDPASDLAAAVLALDATLQLTGPDGSRSIAADQFFRGAFTTALENAEIITAVALPAAPAVSGSAYEKIKNPGQWVSAVWCGSQHRAGPRCQHHPLPAGNYRCDRPSPAGAHCGELAGRQSADCSQYSGGLHQDRRRPDVYFQPARLG